MTDKLKKKKNAFVTNQLQELIKSIDKNVLYLRYEAEEPDEYVYVHFANTYIARINVTCDSLAQMAMDVVRHFA